jgi:hypothetical protein
MQNPVILAIAAALTVYLALDTAVILQSGKTPGLFYKYLRYRQRHGPITLKGNPRRFCIYVIANAVALLICLTFVAWALFSWRPERRDPSAIDSHASSTFRSSSTRADAVVRSSPSRVRRIATASMMRPSFTSIRTGSSGAGRARSPKTVSSTVSRMAL